MRAIGYLSQRAGPARPQTPSLAEQNAQFLDFCTERGYEPTATFLDTRSEISARHDGSVGDAPCHGLDQLLRHLSELDPGFTIVVIQSFAHLAPDATQGVRAALQLRARGAQLVSLDEGPLYESDLLALWQTALSSGPQGQREQERRQRMRKRAERGEAVGRTPYGYNVGPGGRYQIHDHEADVVRLIFRLYLQDDLGIRRIAQRLNRAGYQTRRGRHWSMISIRDLLLNPVYIGSYEKLGFKVADNHPAIISREDFEQVAQRMEQRRTAPGEGQRGQFLLAGLVWCGESGSRMIGVTRRQRWRKADGKTASAVYRYYQSEDRTNRSVGEYHTRRADELEAEVLEQLRSGVNGSASAPTILSLRPDPKAADALAAETAAAVTRAESRRRSLDRRLAQLLEAALGESDERTTLQLLREDAGSIVREWELADQDLTRLRQRVVAQQLEGERQRQHERRLERLREQWDELEFEQQRELLGHLVDQIIVYDHTIQTVMRA